ncbi:hypothetical protein FOA43_002277 [Brettanomyces nanus]|uniref:Auxin efflux carrier n=1 Tax=Eeniella nana TaxID=13502 RepID=A0A875S599_EENNA|nr:uncharacterized protein FOA43_002277 [Brettanomyces nanus]QPG74939.1 hypothetical protein FOA43_002277 [Brettanomyces nanus]
MPDFNYLHITFLTFQAVVEVVIVCVAGFWAATHGLLNSNATKIISRLNVDVFTPALIFTKLASSLSLKKLLEVIIIPILYAVTTFVSLVASTWISSFLNLTEPESNFVTAMGVFGNSNSLPVSLTLALAYTLPGLEWDDVPDDNADKIASRGLVYLLIFQQLGQMLRWSWGYNSLLKKQPVNAIYAESVIPDTDPERNLNGQNDRKHTDTSQVSEVVDGSDTAFSTVHDPLLSSEVPGPDTVSAVPVPVATPATGNYDSCSIDSITLLSSDLISPESANSIPTCAVRTVSRTARGDIVVQIEDKEDSDDELLPVMLATCRSMTAMSELDSPPTGVVAKLKLNLKRIAGWMNPPLWSMVLAIFVASIGPIKYQFYEANGFIQNTLAKSIRELGSVSIPLILVVLGANLAPSTDIPPACRHYSKMIFGALISRMVLPSMVLLPLIVMCVKYIRLSILDDPIFLITSFLLITSPPAIQLSQICQLNEIYQKEMAGVLFYGYVILTLPVTIFIVVTALQCMQWARG